MAMNKVAQKVLVRATELIKRKENWIKSSLFGAEYNLGTGYNVDYDKYCALGAVRKAVCEEFGMPVTEIGNKHLPKDMQKAEAVVRAVLAATAGPSGVVVFNDRPLTQHKDVVAMFCETVKREVTDDIVDEDPS